MGHSVEIATKHYTQTTDEHFRRAVEPIEKTSASRSEKELQKALQFGPASTGTEKAND